MAVPTFNGVALFGQGVHVTTVDNPRSTQQNNYFGLSGIEALDGGQRGRFTEVDGVLSGEDFSGLAVVEELFRSYNDGLYYVLVDTRGVTWQWVRLQRFEPQGPIRQTLAGFYFRPYKAQFFHLT